MPLIRDRIIGHDSERLAFRFTMLSDTDVVECQISDAALDVLGGIKGTESSARQALFLSLRDEVERIASAIFDRGPCVRGQVVRIFTKHVPQPPADMVDTTANADQAASLRIIAETRRAGTAR
jgi:Protein of unknown function (DUF1488)